MIDLREMARMELINCPRTKMYCSSFFPEIPCVYFLFESTELKYVGKTKNLMNRMACHLALTSNKIFDCVGFIKIYDEDERGEFESEMIEKYLPSYNGDFWT